MADDQFILVRYLHPNRGQHAVTGAETKTKYGYRSGGDEFLVHKDDVKRQSHLFEPVGAAVAPPAPTAPPPPPRPAAVAADEDPLAEPVPAAAEAESDFPAELGAAPDHEFNLRRLPGVTPDIAAQLHELGVQNAQDLIEMGSEGLVAVKGIGPAKAEAIIGAVVRVAAVAAQA